MISRLIRLLLLGFAVWGGMRLERFLHFERCLDAGGRVDARGICTGVDL